MAFWDKWFQQKASAVTGQIVAEVGGGTRPVYTPRDFAALAREGYSQNVYVYRAIMTIAQAASAVPWKLYRTGRKLTEVDDDHPLLDLMRNPNPEQGGSAFWKAVVAYWYIAGNSYIEAVGPGRGGPAELWTLRPDRMRVVPNQQSRIGGYIYSVSGAETKLDIANVLHLKSFDPLNDWYGISPIVIASRIIDQMNAANDWNTALLQNSARPPGALSTATKLDSNQRDLLKGDIKRLYSGPRNAGRPLLLESGLTWQDMGTTPEEMDWLAGKTMNGREIAIAIGVAPELLGDSANKTYSNIQEARKALMSETVLPILHEMRDGLNGWLVPMYDESLRLDIDTSGIEALQEDEATKRQAALSAYAGGVMMLNEARKEHGLEEVEDGNVFLITNTATLTPEDEILPVEDEEDTGPMPPMLLNPALSTNDPNAPPLQSIPSASDLYVDNKSSRRRAETKMVNLRSASAKAQYANDLARQRTTWTKQVTDGVQAQLAAQAKAVQALVDSAHSTNEIHARLPHALKHSGDWKTLLQMTYKHVGASFAKQAHDQIMSAVTKKSRYQTKDIFSDDDEGDDFYGDPVVMYLNKIAGKKISDLDDTTLGTLRGALDAGVGNGESIKDIGQRLQDAFTQMSDGRANTIAQTEVIAASNYGSLSGAQATGLDGLQKVWLATEDSHTREAHADADGQTVGMDDTFTVDGEDLQFPGDPSGSAENIINCRCTQTYDTSGVSF